MYARDHAAQALGITVEAIGPGFARCRMAVRQDMVNGHDTCHGGLTFTLADMRLRLRLQRLQPRHRGARRARSASSRRRASATS